MSTEVIDAGAADIINVAREAQHRKDQLQGVDPKKNYVAFGDSGHPVIVDLESLRETPDRASGTYHPATVDSLIAYVEEHGTNEATTIWVHESEGKVRVVLDDHAATKPGWRAHRANLDLRPSAEWNYWLGKDDYLMEQTDFAEHLEEGMPDIIVPDGADLVEIADKFQATSSVVFRSKVNRTSGEVKFQYDESIEAKGSTAEGEVAIPKTFTISIPPFIGEDKAEIVARIRFKVQGQGKLMVGYKLERPQLVKEDAIDKVAETLGKFDRVYRGSPA